MKAAAWVRLAACLSVHGSQTAFMEETLAAQAKHIILGKCATALQGMLLQRRALVRFVQGQGCVRYLPASAAACKLLRVHSTAQGWVAHRAMYTAGRYSCACWVSALDKKGEEAVRQCVVILALNGHGLRTVHSWKMQLCLLGISAGHKEAVRQCAVTLAWAGHGLRAVHSWKMQLCLLGASAGQ